MISSNFFILTFSNNLGSCSNALMNEARFTETLRKYFIHGGFNDEVITIVLSHRYVSCYDIVIYF